MTEGSGLIRGLEGVVAAETRLCDLDGVNGRLAYGGYDIDELARRRRSRRSAYLLWLRRAAQAGPARRAGRRTDGGARDPGRLVQAFGLMPKATDPMRVLQAAAAILGMSTPTPPTTPTRPTSARRCGSPPVSPPRSAPITGSRQGQAPVAARRRSLARRQLPLHAHRRAAERGGRPRPSTPSLTLYAEHELNASTFTTRVIASTQSDMHSAVAGGVGALKGPLHGGAGEAVMRTLMEIGEVGQRRRLRREGARREAAAHGHGPPRLQGGRPARRDPARAWPRRRAGSPASSSGTRWRSSSTSGSARPRGSSPTSTSTRRRSSTRSASRSISSRRSSPPAASPAGPPTSSSSTTTTA